MSSEMVSIGLFSLSLFVLVQRSMYPQLKLSVSDVIVSQKRFQWRQKATVVWAGHSFSLLYPYHERLYIGLVGWKFSLTNRLNFISKWSLKASL